MTTALVRASSDYIKIKLSILAEELSSASGAQRKQPDYKQKLDDVIRLQTALTFQMFGDLTFPQFQD